MLHISVFTLADRHAMLSNKRRGEGRVLEERNGEGGEGKENRTEGGGGRRKAREGGRYL